MQEKSVRADQMIKKVNEMLNEAHNLKRNSAYLMRRAKRLDNNGNKIL